MSNDYSTEKCKSCPMDGQCPIQKMFRVSEHFQKMIETEKDAALDRLFRQPDIFKLVQNYEILEGIGEEFDLKGGYYNEMLASMSSEAREKFEENILLGDQLMLAIRALILQRADQLAKAATDGICTRDGVCYKCWLAEVCKAKAERW